MNLSAPPASKTDISSIHDAIQTLINKAHQLNQSGRPSLATEILSKAIEQAPQARALRCALAEILLENERYQEALTTLTQWETEDFDVRKALLECAGLQGVSRFQEAEDLVDRIIDRGGFSAAALNLKGGLLYRRHKKQAAEACFAGAIEKDPADGRAHLNLGLLKLEAGQTQTAFDHIAQAFEAAPQNKSIADTFHEIISELNLHAYAEGRFRDACRRFPQNKRLIYLLIDILIHQNKHREALENIQNAMAVFGIEDGILEPALKIRNRLRPQDAKGGKGKVSLCMIVKDEAAHLARCLASVRRMVDQIVVVDTGSADRSRDIATVFGADVYAYAWRNDFARARNHALSKADCEWVLILDADEVIAARDHECILSCIQGRLRDPCAYTFITRNYTHDVGIEGWQANDDAYPQESAGGGWYPSAKVRLFPNDDRFRFENAVHELVEPSLRRAGLPIKTCPAAVHHYGELNRRKTGAKKARYYSLGKRKITANPSGPLALMEHAIQAQELGAHEEALALWEAALKHRPDLAKAYFNMSYCHIQLERYHQGLEAAQKALELNPTLKEAVLNRSLCNIRTGNCRQAIKDLDYFLFEVPGHPLATGLLAVADCICGNPDRGLRQFDKISQLGFNCTEYIYEQAQKLISAGRRDDAARLLQAVGDSMHAKEQIRALLSELTRWHVQTGPIRIYFFDLKKVNPNFGQHLKLLEDYRSPGERCFASVKDENNADFIFFPYSIDTLYHQLGYDEFSRFLRQLPLFSRYARKFVFFLLDDISARFDIASVIYRVNHDKRKMDLNSITLPYFTDDMYVAPMGEKQAYHVNFIGTLITHILRTCMLIPFLSKAELALYNCFLKNLQELVAKRKDAAAYQDALTNTMHSADNWFPMLKSIRGVNYYLDITVEQFHKLPHRIQSARKTRLKEIMAQSRAVLCPRGFGVQSIRFFETLSAGRIPILISNNYILPLENQIDYATVIWNIDESKVMQLPAEIAALFESMRRSDISRTGARARELWLEFFAPAKRHEFIQKSLAEVLARNYELNAIVG